LKIEKGKLKMSICFDYLPVAKQRPKFSILNFPFSI